MENSNATGDGRPVFFFDIDNCLYSRSKKVHDMMKTLIRQYFATHLQLSPEESQTLHETYYQQYGLAIEGLVRHHKIDPLEYNRLVDDALPLEAVLHPDPELRALLQSINTSKVKLWLFTNAYVNHGKRVVKLLGVEDLFEGITYCDYASPPLVCKPKREAYELAMRQSGATDPGKCYFIDDSAINCQAAVEFGWKNVIHKLEPEDPDPEFPHGRWHIRDLKELKTIFPEVFKEGEVEAK
ncbi:Haloacid dehalogenase-like hydrolase-domain-containing protein [Sphaerosporella brunnea]|uniref:Haloacid dehalogenase-like hydrolase-domain-containing protein n=1 Tax=Sphaerosporella brunnea TaxID=1250544 RepID=A0A5J5EV49_9PEZI|nr:Haloacid dehalogenase-like hydrolase-domain-containing protein [Sphaerosporella brunnea]